MRVSLYSIWPRAPPPADRKAKATNQGSSLTAAPRLGYFVLSGFVPVRRLAGWTVARLVFAIRIARNPLMLTSSTAKAPDCDFYFRHEPEHNPELYYPQVTYFR